MWIVILVFILSKPEEPPAFGIIGEFKSTSECVQAIASLDVSDEQKSRLRCMELRKPREI